MEKFICKTCKEEKLISLFHFRDRSINLRKTRCKKCENESISHKNATKVTSLKNEVWKDILDYEGYYQISNFGRVKSLKREVKHKKSGVITLKGKLMAISLTENHYYSIELNKLSLHKNHLLHRLIANAFIPNPENKPQVNHKDGNKENNSIDNLEWNTAKENSQHAVYNNLVQLGEKRKDSKLTNDKVRAIKRLLRINPNVNRCNLSKKVGITNGVIYQIINKTTWKHINI